MFSKDWEATEDKLVEVMEWVRDNYDENEIRSYEYSQDSENEPAFIDGVMHGNAQAAYVIGQILGMF